MNFLQNIFDLYINPEIKKRQSQGEIPIPFVISSAQVLFCLDESEPIVRLNSEVKAKAEYKLKSSVEKKEQSEPLLNDIDVITNVELILEKDKNCGHVTIIKLADKWSGSFDFRYNNDFAKKYLSVAKQFIETAKFSKDKKYYNVFVDNCFSASELIAKSVLILSPDKKFKDKANHNTIKSRINLYSKQGNFNKESLDIYNYLSNLRSNARYLKGNFIMEKEPDDILRQIEILYNEAMHKIE